MASMRRAQSACGGLLPAPAEQTQCGEAGGEEWQRSRERDRVNRVSTVSMGNCGVSLHPELMANQMLNAGGFSLSNLSAI
jgi:hypothetical protein